MRVRRRVMQMEGTRVKVPESGVEAEVKGEERGRDGVGVATVGGRVVFFSDFDSCFGNGGGGCEGGRATRSPAMREPVASLRCNLRS